MDGLVDRPPEPRRVWNRLREEDRQYVVRYATGHPSLGPKEGGSTSVDEQVMYVSESTVYRMLKEAELIKPPVQKVSASLALAEARWYLSRSHS